MLSLPQYTFHLGAFTVRNQPNTSHIFSIGFVLDFSPRRLALDCTRDKCQDLQKKPVSINSTMSVLRMSDDAMHKPDYDADETDFHILYISMCMQTTQKTSIASIPYPMPTFCSPLFIGRRSSSSVVVSIVQPRYAR